MAKVLLLIAVVAIVYFLLKNYQRAIARETGRDEPRTPAVGTAEDMVRCAHCGVHLPASESFMSKGSHYCSEEHRRLGPRAREGD